MDKFKILTIALSLISATTIWLGFASSGKVNWFPPGGGIVP